MPTRSDDHQYVTTQTAGGRYKAGLTIDNPDNFPIHQKLRIARYIIPGPPVMMCNIPKYYAATKLLYRQVLRFDIRNPWNYQQLWGRKQYTRENTTQDCIIGTPEPKKRRTQKSLRENQPIEPRKQSTQTKRQKPNGGSL